MIVVNRAEVERLMVENNVTRNTLLKNYGMTYVTFDNIMNNKQETSMKSIGVLCDALKCQPEDILIRVKNE